MHGRSDLALLSRNAILGEAPKSRRDRRVRLSVNLELDGERKPSSVDPDEFFGLRFLVDEEESYFMLEIDRGEMPIERFKNEDQTYFPKKMSIYQQANREDVHGRELGISNFRVLTVTTTKGRVDEMIASLRNITNGNGSNMFLFADAGTLSGSNALDLEWVSGKGETVRLTD